MNHEMVFSRRAPRVVLAFVGLLVSLIVVQPARAQVFRVLHYFTPPPDGGHPSAGPTRDAVGNLYGTTEFGGTFGAGTVFKLDPTGKETVLYSFTGGVDGGYPAGGVLTLDSAGNLYGTTPVGGAGDGVVFKVDPTGKETVLHSFAGGADGVNPNSGVVRDSTGNLYGTTPVGGTAPAAAGVIFKWNTTGKESVLHSFAGGADGDEASGNLVLDAEGNLYGTTFGGGALGVGIVFKLDTARRETVLHTFTGPDGSEPDAGLVRDSAGNLYGTTQGGGAWRQGAVFKVDTTGKESVLYSFRGGADGAAPTARVVLDGEGNLYGTTNSGGTGCFFGCGVVFKLDPTGKETVLHSFTGPDGTQPLDLVLDPAGNLYGTTLEGGIQGCSIVFTSECGVVFKITLPNFKITASPTSAIVFPGQSTTSTLTLAPVAGFTGTIDLSCVVPSGDGLSCGVSPTSVTLNRTSSASSTLSIKTSSATPTGTYKIRAKGISGSLIHSTIFTLTVQ